MEETVAALLAEKKKTLALAESCTGGLISRRIARIPGISAYYLGGVVSYANEAKMELLGVNRDTLQKFGAVSEQTAREMSQGIRQLERELQLTLFHRTGRNLVLNPAGQLLLEPARRVLGDVVAAEDIMRGARELQVGSITIGTMPEMSSEAVAAWSASFTRLYPDIRIDLSEFPGARELCDEVLAGHCELGFTTFPVPTDNLERVELGHERRIHTLARLVAGPQLVSERLNYVIGGHPHVRGARLDRLQDRV